MDAHLKYTEYEDFLVLDKPEGITTHRSNPEDLGIAEFYESRLQKKVYVVHRLDLTTSGVLVLALTAESAQKLTDLFKEKQVQKEYLFLTDHVDDFKQKTYSSFIEKKGKENLSTQTLEPNATTVFELVQKIQSFYLWKAKPLTGKSHQIRLHARDLGLPILGDDLYGGTSAERIFLHAQRISFPWNNKTVSFEAHAPFWSEDWISAKLTRCLQLGLERRQRTYKEFPNSFRLHHHEFSDLTVEQLSGYDWFSWFRDTAPTEDELALMNDFVLQRNSMGFVRHMKNRGQDPNANLLWPLGKASLQKSLQWPILENQVTYEMRSQTGLSPGLFLDQRKNREWVLKNSKNLKVLNLFSYTCGFSVCAALGEAEQVVSVDVSSQFLEWGKNNFRLNQLQPEKYEFFKQDVLLFLKGTIKRQRKFDLIIADPPSFGRSDQGVFQFKKDWLPLLNSILEVLSPKGKILFSSNFESWNTKEFQMNMQSWATKNRLHVQATPIPDLDFETSTVDRKMKSLFLVRR